MSHISRELFFVLVWGDLLLVVGVFLYLLYALRDAGGNRFELSGERDSVGSAGSVDSEDGRDSAEGDGR